MPGSTLDFEHKVFKLISSPEIKIARNLERAQFDLADFFRSTKVLRP